MHFIRQEENPVRNVNVWSPDSGQYTSTVQFRLKKNKTFSRVSGDFCLIQKINWEDLAAKKVPALFKPVIRDELDVSNFAEEFTEMDPTYSPAALPQNCDRIFKVRVRET